MTHWRKEIRKEADKNVREHERGAVMGGYVQDFRGKFLVCTPKHAHSLVNEVLSEKQTRSVGKGEITNEL